MRERSDSGCLLRSTRERCACSHFLCYAKHRWPSVITPPASRSFFSPTMRHHLGLLSLACGAAASYHVSPQPAAASRSAVTARAHVPQANAFLKSLFGELWHHLRCRPHLRCRRTCAANSTASLPLCLSLAVYRVSCGATGEDVSPKTQPVRFAIGDTVQCRTGHHSWEEGSVVALMYRDDAMPEGMIAPYQVQLLSCPLIMPYQLHLSYHTTHA